MEIAAIKTKFQIAKKRKLCRMSIKRIKVVKIRLPLAAGFKCLLSKLFFFIKLRKANQLIKTIPKVAKYPVK